MKEEYKILFKKLGYDVESKGALLYGALIDDVRDLIVEGKSESEIRDTFPSLCLELYRFCYETTRVRFFNYINSFRSSINVKMRKTENKLLELGLTDDGFEMELEDSILYFANYFINESKRQDTSKVMIKENQKLLKK